MFKWIIKLLFRDTPQPTIVEDEPGPLDIALERLEKFRARGETFGLSGVTFTVLSFSSGYHGGLAGPAALPSMGCVYTDNLGVVHDRKFHAWELTALRAENPHLTSESTDD